MDSLCSIDRAHAPTPYTAVADYCTSMWELAGKRYPVDDDVADRLPSEQVPARRRLPNASELTSRMPSPPIGATLPGRPATLGEPAGAQRRDRGGGEERRHRHARSTWLDLTSSRTGTDNAPTKRA